jgi:GMP synthase (glutamine-hydrolysing)
MIGISGGYPVLPFHNLTVSATKCAKRHFRRAQYSRRVRVLSVTHGPSVLGGIFDETVENAGHELERWSVPIGGAPQPASSYDAVMVFGGAMHPDQDERFPWLKQEAAFLEEVLGEEVPAVGVCLGAQMLARAAGSWVAPARSAEIGWFDVELTPEGEADPVLGVLGACTTALQWHHYTFGIPEQGTELARSELCSQAFRVGNAWAIQFHAEVTGAMVQAWINEDGHELPMSPEEFLAETQTRIAGWNEQGRALCAAFLAAAGS